MTQKPNNSNLLVCNCQRTMVIDAAGLSKALGFSDKIAVHQELCRAGISAFESGLMSGQPVHVACTQEAPLFREIAAEHDFEAELRFSNIRETAGWSEAKSSVLPKMAALLADASYEPEPATTLTLDSKGMCLVYGAGQAALETAASLEGRLSVTVLLSDIDDAMPPSVVSQPIYKGKIRTARGALGRFEVVVDGYAPVVPSSRDTLEFAMPRDGASAQCDLILDISGGKPLFTGHGRRDGYISADPNNPGAVARAMFEISDLVGEFEKPRYIAYDASICAHARSGKVGCSNCLDVCPLGAISPAGDNVLIDPAICGGCGNCAAACPTGAASYAVPRRGDLVNRLGIILDTYRGAGGAHPRIMFHDEKHGAALIGAMARFGRGLPANVIPVRVNSTMMIGHDTMAATLALGADQVVVLSSPEHPEELETLRVQSDLARTIVSALGYEGDRIIMIDEHDPDAVENSLYDQAALAAMTRNAFSALGSKREVARTAFTKLYEGSPTPTQLVALPEGAPYGRIVVDVNGCTLCLSCVGACPANALGDNPERPELSFTEAACVQCGVCVATCPENVISLEPRYDFSPQALTPTVIKFEEPFNCIRCGTPFGARSSVERVVERLKGHSMFRDAGQLELIQMCDTCRIETLANSGNDPFAGGERPRVRTTDDYLSAEAEAARTGKAPEDFLN